MLERRSRKGGGELSCQTKALTLTKTLKRTADIKPKIAVEDSNGKQTYSTRNAPQKNEATDLCSESEGGREAILESRNMRISRTKEDRGVQFILFSKYYPYREKSEPEKKYRGSGPKTRESHPGIEQYVDIRSKKPKGRRDWGNKVSKGRCTGQRAPGFSSKNPTYSHEGVAEKGAVQGSV